jgi:hypothetical protein
MRRVITVLVLALPIAATAEFRLGLDVNYNFVNDIQTSEATNPALDMSKDKTVDFGLQPYIGIKAGEVLEISPFVGWGLHRLGTYTKDTGSTAVDNTWTQNNLATGIGIYFHVVHGDVFGLSLGPQLGYRIYFEPTVDGTNVTAPQYSTYYLADVWLGCPLNIDIHFTKHFSARLGAPLFNFNYHTHSIKQKGASTTDVVHDFNIDALTTLLNPSLGLYFSFGSN